PAPGRKAARRRSPAAGGQSPGGHAARRRVACVPSRRRSRSKRRPSHLLQVDEERLELGRPGVGVAHEGGQGVGEPVTPLTWVAVRGQSDVATMNRYSDLVNIL